LRRSFELILSEGEQTPADVTGRIALQSSDIESLSGLPHGYLGDYARVSLLRPPGLSVRHNDLASVTDLSDRRQRN
jgi:hypothetical protein